jgi:hypothetical protein
VQPRERVELHAVRQHQVEQHDVDAAPLQSLQRLGEGTRGDQLEDGTVRLREQPLEQLELQRVVLDREDADMRFGHDKCSPAGPRGI